MIPAVIRTMHSSFAAALAIAILIAAPAAVPASSGAAFAQESGMRGTGLPVPRFVSLKSDEVNVRRGPGQDYDVAFIFLRAGLPVEITQEFDNWRKIRDSEGSEGWVFHSLLSGERTALVAPWDRGKPLPVHHSAADEAPVVAYLQPRVVAEVEECTGSWCLISGSEFRGWMEQERLWGVYPQERVED